MTADGHRGRFWVWLSGLLFWALMNGMNADERGSGRMDSQGRLDEDAVGDFGEFRQGLQVSDDGFDLG